MLCLSCQCSVPSRQSCNSRLTANAAFQAWQLWPGTAQPYTAGSTASSDICLLLLLRLLMELAEQAILEGKGDCEDGARDVVGVAHDSISWLGEKEGAVILGSSTICLGLVRPGGLLEMANVGDSGFRVIRGDETVFASEVSCLQGIKTC